MYSPSKLYLKCPVTIPLKLANPLITFPMITTPLYVHICNTYPQTPLTVCIFAHAKMNNKNEGTFIWLMWLGKLLSAPYCEHSLHIIRRSTECYSWGFSIRICTVNNQKIKDTQRHVFCSLLSICPCLSLNPRNGWSEFWKLYFSKIRAFGTE